MAADLREDGRQGPLQPASAGKIGGEDREPGIQRLFVIIKDQGLARIRTAPDEIPHRLIERQRFRRERGPGVAVREEPRPQTDRLDGEDEAMGKMPAA
jgi:hypothetical protein